MSKREVMVCDHCAEQYEKDGRTTFHLTRYAADGMWDEGDFRDLCSPRCLYAVAAKIHRESAPLRAV